MSSSIEKSSFEKSSFEKSSSETPSIETSNTESPRDGPPKHYRVRVVNNNFHDYYLRVVVDFPCSCKVCHEYQRIDKVIFLKSGGNIRFDVCERNKKRIAVARDTKVDTLFWSIWCFKGKSYVKINKEVGLSGAVVANVTNVKYETAVEVLQLGKTMIPFSSFFS